MKKPFIILFTLILSINIGGNSLTIDAIHSEKKLNLLTFNRFPNAYSALKPIPFSHDQPIELYLENEGNLRAQFNKDQGELLIQIIDNTNTSVYEYTVHTGYEKEIHIAASALPSGTYTIYFIKNSDQYWYAEFELE